MVRMFLGYTWTRIFSHTSGLSFMFVWVQVGPWCERERFSSASQKHFTVSGWLRLAFPRRYFLLSCFGSLARKMDW